MQYLRENDLVHGKFRPSNVLLTRQNKIKVSGIVGTPTDLGIRRHPPYDKDLESWRWRSNPPIVDIYRFGNQVVYDYFRLLNLGIPSFPTLLGIVALEVLVHSLYMVRRWITGFLTTLEKPKDVPSGLWTFLLELVSYFPPSLPLYLTPSMKLKPNIESRPSFIEIVQMLRLFLEQTPGTATFLPKPVAVIESPKRTTTSTKRIVKPAMPSTTLPKKAPTATRSTSAKGATAKPQPLGLQRATSMKPKPLTSRSVQEVGKPKPTPALQRRTSTTKPKPIAAQSKPKPVAKPTTSTTKPKPAAAQSKPKPVAKPTTTTRQGKGSGTPTADSRKPSQRRTTASNLQPSHRQGMRGTASEEVNKRDGLAMQNAKLTEEAPPKVEDQEADDEISSPIIHVILPPEVMMLIFSFLVNESSQHNRRKKRSSLDLYTCRLICSEWNGLALDPSLPIHSRWATYTALQSGNFEVTVERVSSTTIRGFSILSKSFLDDSEKGPEISSHLQGRPRSCRYHLMLRGAGEEIARL